MDLYTRMAGPTLPTQAEKDQAAALAAGPNAEAQKMQEKQKADQAAKDATLAAATAAPNVIQQGPDGFQAMKSQDGGPEAQQFLATQEKRKADEATRAQAVNDMNAAATKSGVSAYFDQSIGQWVDSTTGKPQLARSTEPVTQGKYGPQRGDMILDGLYFGLTTGQADAIENAGSDIKAKYDVAIGQQEETSKQEQAKALIQGGQAGGFMSSQVAGKAATAVGGSWTGAGGTLGRLKAQYDDSIQRLKQEEGAAIQKAKDYALTAARTGDAAYYDAANAAARSVDEIKAKQQETAKQQADDAKALSDIGKLETGDATATISNLVANGYTDYDSLPKAYTDDLDAHLQAGGMPPGSARMIFATQQETLAAKKLTDETARRDAETKNAASIVGIMKDIPSGTSMTVGDQTYMGLSKADYQQGTETDQTGRVTHWSYNPDTGAVSSVDLGYVGKPSDGWTSLQTDQGWFNYNPTTKQSIPLEPGTGMTTFQSLFPNGSQSPFRDSSDPMQGQCGAFCNDLYGQKLMGSKLSEKLAAAKNYPTVAPTDLQYGDTFIMSSGDTGHIGVVLGTKTDKDGNLLVLRGESNMVPPGGGKISSTEWMKASDARVKGFWRIPTPNLPSAGTDSGVTSSIMGPTIGGKPISEVVGGGVTEKPLTTTELQARGVDVTDPATIGLTESGLKQYMASHPVSTDVAGTTGSANIDTKAAGYYDKVIEKAGGMTQAAIDQAAMAYAVTGVMPSIGMGSTGAAGQKRTVIQNRAAELGQGTNIVVNKARLKSLTDSLDVQQKYLDTTQRSVENADAGFNQLLTAFSGSGINTSDSKVKNQWVNDFRKNVTGGGDIRAFDAGLAEVANEYSQVFSRGGQTSESTKKRAQEIMDGNISIKDLQGVQKELQAQGKIVIEGAQKQVDTITDQMGNILGGKETEKTSKPTAPTEAPPTGEIWITRNGVQGSIPESEFESSTDVKL